jgi:UDP-glucose 4-epimerase
MSRAHSCVVLGGSGFLGQRLCERLVAEGFRVLSVSRSGAPSGVHDPWCSEVEWVAAPLGSEKSVEVLESSDFLFHLASTTVPSTSNSNIMFDLESNVVATVRVLQAAVASKMRRVVFVSSGGAVYGVSRQNLIDENHPTDPICSYGIQKLTIEKYLQLYHSIAGLDSIVLRVSNAYGEWQSSKGEVGAIAHFTDKAIHGRPIEIWGDGSIIRDYIHVDDVVSALVGSVKYRGAERLFNIGTGRGVSLNQLVDMIRARVEQQVRAIYKPSRSFDVRENVLNVSRARQELMWTSSIPLEEGLDRMIGKVYGRELPLKKPFDVRLVANAE